MTTRPFVTAIAIVLTTVIVTPSVFFIAPPRAHAVDFVFDIPTEIKTALTAINDVLIEAHTYTSMVAAYAQELNTFVFQPLAFILSGNLMKALTASVVQFVIGKTNGTGAPQFVVSLQKSMQTLSDAKNKAFISQFGLTGSPFASSISTALNKNYTQGSSLAGFWAANTCTLSKSSPNVSAYLAGSWSQGGVGAWFALTTQSQNNPYTLYQNSQAQLANVVGGAVAARTSELNWGSGFMSWCSVSDSATQTQNAASTAYQVCMANGGTGDTCQATFENSGGLMTAVGINPGDACTNSDGSTGTIQTPGSTIKATLDKVLGGQQDKLVAMGNISSQITGILSDVSKIMQTVQFASSILGGSSGGLLSSGPQVAQFAPTRDSSGNFTSGYGGVTNAQVNQTAASSNTVTASSADLTSRVQMYQTAWSTINAAANRAQASITSLINTCTANIATAKTQLQSTQNQDSMLQVFIDTATPQIAAAQTALSTEVTPVLTQASGVPVVVAAILAMNDQVKSELASGSTSYTTDLQTLQSMPPTSSDASKAQQNAQIFNAAKANPNGSLTVPADPTIVDQMNLISANAATLESTVCAPVP